MFGISSPHPDQVSIAFFWRGARRCFEGCAGIIECLMQEEICLVPNSSRFQLFGCHAAEWRVLVTYTQSTMIPFSNKRELLSSKYLLRKAHSLSSADARWRPTVGSQIKHKFHDCERTAFFQCIRKGRSEGVVFYIERL